MKKIKLKHDIPVAINSPNKDSLGQIIKTWVKY